MQFAPSTQAGFQATHCYHSRISDARVLELKNAFKRINCLFLYWMCLVFVINLILGFTSLKVTFKKMPITSIFCSANQIMNFLYIWILDIKLQNTTYILHKNWADHHIFTFRKGFFPIISFLDARRSQGHL